MEEFKCIVAITLGKSLSEVESWPATELQRLRRFYQRHPFGPLRGDLQAWLAGTQALFRRPVELNDVPGLFVKATRRTARKRRKLPKSTVTPALLQSLCLQMGGEVKGSNHA